MNEFKVGDTVIFTDPEWIMYLGWVGIIEKSHGQNHLIRKLDDPKKTIQVGHLGLFHKYCRHYTKLDKVL